MSHEAEWESKVRHMAGVQKNAKWSNRFVLATIVQVLAATALTAYLLYQAVFGVPAASRIVAGGGAGTWFTVGFIGYLILGPIAVGMTAMLYRHLETHQSKSFLGWKSALAGGHLVLWNVGVVGATWLMMNAGLRGGGAAIATTFGGLGWNTAQVHTIMSAYPTYIAVFIAIALAGIALGALGYLSAWLSPVGVERAVPANGRKPTV